jgi:hypothetical protein
MWHMSDMFGEFRHDLLRAVPVDGYVAMVFAHVPFCDPDYLLFNYLPKHVTRIKVSIRQRPAWHMAWTLPAAYDVCFSVHPNDVRTCFSRGAQLDS